MKIILEEIESVLAAEVKTVVDYFERYVTAKAFWLEEFDLETPESNLALESRGKQTAGMGHGWANATIDKDSVSTLQAECRADVSTILIAAYSAVLSRLIGREAVVIICHLNDGGGAKIVPLRLNPYWNLSFRKFVQRVAQKLEVAASHSEYAFEVLNNEISRFEPGDQFPVFDAGYIFARCADAAQGPPTFDDLSMRFNPYHRKFDLILEAAQDEKDLTIRLVHEGSRYCEEMAVKLAAYLRMLLVEAANDPGAQLGDINLDGDLAAISGVNRIVQASFHF